MVASNPDGVDMVENSNGKYAFFMESSSIEYLVERRCKLAQVRLQSLSQKRARYH
jgi:ionotropic glutamate receptor